MEKIWAAKKKERKKIQLEKNVQIFERDIQEPGHTVLGFGVIQHVQERSMHNPTYLSGDFLFKKIHFFRNENLRKIVKKSVKNFRCWVF